MSKLLEIFGKGVTINTADLVWHWLNSVHIVNDNPDNFKQSEFDQVIDSIGKMRLKDAEDKLKFYLFENPDSAHGKLAMVCIHLHNNNIQEAMNELEQLNRIQPSNTMGLYCLGYCYERIGQENKAMEYYQDCLKFKSFLQLPRQRLAAIHLKNGRVDKALKQYEMLTTEHPEDITSKTMLGYLYIAEHQYQAAIDAFNMAILSHPDNFHEENARKEEQSLEEGDLEGAMEQIVELIEQVGEQPDLYVRMGDIHERAGRPAEALVCYETALKFQPSYLEASIKLGTHYLRCRQPALAAEQFNRAIEINDEIVDSYVGLATAEAMCGKLNGAYRTLSLAAAIEQNSVMLFSETATLHLQVSVNTEMENNDPSEAVNIDIKDVVAAHGQKLRKNPRNADAHYKYGILMMVVNEPDLAIQSFKTTVKINPTHYRAKSKLAICLFETGKNKEALKELTGTNSLDISTLNLHYKTSILFCDKQRFAAAMTNIENSYKNNFTDVAADNIEVVLENIGLIDRAIATWDRLTETAKAAISERFH